MSAATMVFNKGVLKLLLALAIPGSIGYFFYYSQQQAIIEVEKYKQEQKNHPTTDKLAVDNYQMKEVDDYNHIHWQLTAKSGTLMPNGQDVELHGVQMDYFDKVTNALKMRITAPVGNANQNTKYVKLSGDGRQKVVADGGEGKSRLECQAVELTKKNQFLASGGVIIDWPGVAKVSGNSATGSMNLSAGPKDFKIIGNTHAEIAVK